MEQHTDKLKIEHTIEETWITFNDREILDEAYIKDIESQLSDVIAAGKRPHLLLNFAAVEFMSSSFLGLLVKIEKRLKDGNRELTLCNIKPQIMKVFKLTKLDSVFDII